MKKFCISLALLSIITLTVIAGCNINQDSAKYLRIHIRANSNSQIDQQVKYSVKESIVAYLTPIVADCNDLDSAINAVKKTVLTINLVWL